MVAAGLTTKPFPVPANVPPQEAVYHFIVSPVPPPPPFSVSVVLPPLQIVAELAEAEVGSADFWLTVIVTTVEFAEVHTPLVTTAR